MSRDSIPVLFSVACDMYLALHTKSIRDQFPETKLWKHEWVHDGRPFTMRVNGIGDDNDGLEPFGMQIFGNGWPIFVGNPAGGAVAMITEDELVNILKSEMHALQTRAEEFPASTEPAV